MESIIITSLTNKKNILKNNFQNKILSNTKFLTFQDLKKKLFFDYDYRAIAFIVENYSVSIAVAKIYLNNLYFLKNIDSDKVSFLLELKRILDEKELLIYNSDFASSFKNKKVYIYGYSILSREQKLILEKLDTTYQIYEMNYQTYLPKVYEALSMEEEVHFVLEEIATLIDKGILLSHIKVIAPEEYDNILIRYFYLYGIPFNKKEKHTFYSTLVAQDFLARYDEVSLEENILTLSEKYSNVEELIKIINRSVLVQDKKMRKNFIIEDLKNNCLKDTSYDSAVEFVSFYNSFSDQDYVFLLGFNVNDYPKIKRDIDYLSDSIKEKLGLDTSILVNKYEVVSILDQLKRIKNLVITYKLTGLKGKYYPSILLKQLPVPILPIHISHSISHSKKYSKMEYAMDLDLLHKYNIVTSSLELFQNSLEIPYQTYNNQFSGVDSKLIKEKLNYELTLSYTNMEMYQECAFRYYISKILCLDIFEETFKTIIGNIMHHILELGIVKDIDISAEIMKFVKEKEYVLNAKEMFYLEKFSEDLKNILQVIREQEKHSKLHSYLFENEFYDYKDRKNMKITFKGMIDKVMYTNIHGKEVLAVVDYKTGNTNITLQDLDYGLHLQLPIYLYLLKKSERFHDAFIAGFYIQKVLPKKENIQFKKSLHEQLKEKLALQGFTNRDENLMEMIDDDYQNSGIIKNLQFKKNGEISSKSKVITNEEMHMVIDKIDQIIDKVIRQILDGQFFINPKVINQKNIACTYCKFKDLCFMKKQNEVVLGGDYVEVDNRAKVSH